MDTWLEFEGECLSGIEEWNVEEVGVERKGIVLPVGGCFGSCEIRQGRLVHDVSSIARVDVQIVREIVTSLPHSCTFSLAIRFPT